MSIFAKIFGRDRHGCEDPWEMAPTDSVEIGTMLVVIIIQNEMILAELQKRPSKLSPQDQARINEIFEKVTADTAKIDEALPKA